MPRAGARKRGAANDTTPKKKVPRTSAAGSPASSLAGSPSSVANEVPEKSSGGQQETPLSTE
eukprot:2887042-Alexandrium_andersonii.AAC.1